jgi:hypothetical protein
MNNTIIICPFCNREIPLTEAISNQMRQQMRKEFEAQHSQQEKLLADREHHAEIAVLLSMALPPEVQNFAPMDGVWVTDLGCAIGLASALRQGLLSVAGARRAETDKREKAEVLYSYLSSTEFRQRIEAVVEAFVSMKADLDAEKRATARQWAKREKQIEQVVNNTALMYGDLQGIVGQAALPTIKVLELEG